MSGSSLNTIEVDLSALRHNYRSIQERVGLRVRIMAIVKADAYGHGLVRGQWSLTLKGLLTEAKGVTRDYYHFGK